MSRAFRFHRHGGPEVLAMEEVEVGTPGPGQVRMRNKAVAVNYRDILMRRGVHAVKSLPSGIGLESAGVIEAIGPEVEGFSVGDRVAYCIAWGSYAEYAVVPAWRVVKVPAALPLEKAAASVFHGFTAHYLAHDVGRLAPGGGRHRPERAAGQRHNSRIDH